MHDFPEVDTDISGYQAAINFCDSGCRRVKFPGSYDNFPAAASRARRLCAALIAAGETGIQPHVGFVGERPARFPRNGVNL